MSTFLSSGDVIERLVLPGYNCVVWGDISKSCMPWFYYSEHGKPIFWFQGMLAERGETLRILWKNHWNIFLKRPFIKDGRGREGWVDHFHFLEKYELSRASPESGITAQKSLSSLTPCLAEDATLLSTMNARVRTWLWSEVAIFLYSASEPCDACLDLY